jgi:hypothetical protein
VPHKGSTGRTDSVANAKKQYAWDEISKIQCKKSSAQYRALLQMAIDEGSNADVERARFNIFTWGGVGASSRAWLNHQVGTTSNNIMIKF